MKDSTKRPAAPKKKEQAKSVTVVDDDFDYKTKQYPGEINSTKLLKKAVKEHVRRKT